MDLSIVIPCHAEGYILHRTLKNVEVSIQLFNKNNKKIDYEVILVGDSLTEETQTYLETLNEFFQDIPISFYEVDFADPGLTRNYGIEKSSGEYTVLMDGDDLFSVNWLYDAYTMLEDFDGKKIARTEYFIPFGSDDDKYNYYFHKEELSKVQDVIRHIATNPWEMMCMAKSEIFKSVKFFPKKDIYRFEDFKYNCDLLYEGYENFIVPDTITFVRKRKGSVVEGDFYSSRFLAPTKMYQKEYLDSISESELDKFYQNHVIVPEESVVKTTLQNKYVAFIGVLRNLMVLFLPGFVRRFLSRVKKKVIEWFSRDEEPEYKKKFSDEIINQWKEIHEIEKSIFPSEEKLCGIREYKDFLAFANPYVKFVRDVPYIPDLLVLVPFLTTGGADLLFIRMLNAINDHEPDFKILVVSTNDEARESEYKDKLNDGIEFMNLDDYTQDLPYGWRVNMIQRFLVQEGVERLLIANSGLGFDMMKTYGEFLSKLVRIGTFIFCKELDKEGRTYGFMHTHLPEMYEEIDYVVSENESLWREFKEIYGRTENKFFIWNQDLEDSEKTQTLNKIVLS